jgi:PAS domain S-box-containing protein
MELRRQISARILEVLEGHPEGLSITDLVRSVDINRNTAARYLENLLLSGQVEMRRFGMAKMYTLAKRLPVSSVLSLSSEMVLQLDAGQRVLYANEPLLTLLGAQAKDLFGKNIVFTPFSLVFEDEFSILAEKFTRGLKGEEWHGELSCPKQEKVFFCRVTPTVSNEGKKSVTVLLEDISDQKRDEERIRESEARLRSIFRVSPVGIGVAENRVFLEVNNRFCQMTGYSEGELVGKSVRMLYSSEEAFNNVGVEYIRQIRQSGASSIETRWIKKDRTVIDILLGSTPLDPANISGGITFMALDITERNKAERALKESEARLQLALSGSETGMWELEIPSLKGSIDERAAAVLGYQIRNIGSFRADWDALSHPDDVPLIHQRLADYLEGRTSIFESEHRMRHKSGEWKWVVGRGKVTGSLPDGSCKRISGTLQDITARKQVERELQESEDRYRSLAEASRDLIFVIDRDDRVEYVNSYAAAIMGLPADHVIGQKRSALFSGEQGQHQAQGLRRVFETGKPGRSEGAMEISGSVHWFDHFLMPIKNPNGMVTSVLGVSRDITGRKQTEQALQESEERYRKLVEILPDAVFLHQDGRIIYANQAAVHILGATNEHDLLGKNILDFVKPEYRDVVRGHIARDLHGEVTPSLELQMSRVDGSPIVVEGRGVATTIDGRPSVLVVVNDIAERKRIEEVRRESEEQLLQREQQYRFIVDNSLDIISLMTPDHICTYVSPAVTPLLGYAGMEVVGRPLLTMVHPDDLGNISGKLAAIARNGVDNLSLTFRIRHRDGHYLWFETMTTVIRDDRTGQVREFLSISRDLTVRKEAEEALVASEERYRCLLGQLFDAVAIHKDKKIAFLNLRAARILGAATPEDLVGRSIFDLIHPDSRKDLEERIRMITTDPSQPAPLLQEKFFRADGTVVTVEVMAIQITDNGLPAIQVMFREIASPEPE